MLPNRAAFCAVVGFSEGTDSQADPFRVCFGYKHTIVSFAEHPAITGEWHGEKLSDEMCRGAGLGPGCVSTAAGRGQIKKATWIEARDGLKKAGLLLPGDLFSPQNQNLAIIWLAGNRALTPGAIDDIDAGRVGAAVAKCRKLWASFPGASYAGQPERRLTALLAAFTRAGGTLAPSPTPGVPS